MKLKINITKQASSRINSLRRTTFTHRHHFYAFVQLIKRDTEAESHKRKLKTLWWWIFVIVVSYLTFAIKQVNQLNRNYLIEWCMLCCLWDGKWYDGCVKSKFVLNFCLLLFRFVALNSFHLIGSFVCSDYAYCDTKAERKSLNRIQNEIGIVYKR